MRFACEQCQTKYTIPDERVRGKILKIRCKNCNCQITISEGGVRTARPVESAGGDTIIPTKNSLPALLEEGGGDSTMIGGMADFFGAPGPGPAAGNSAAADEWFVSVDGGTAGPIPIQELAQRVVAEEATPGKEIFVWKEGFGEWLPPADVAEVKLAVQKERRVPAPKPAIAVKPSLMPRLQPMPARAPAPAADLGGSLSEDGEDATQIGSLSAPTGPPPSATKPERSDLALEAVDFDVVTDLPAPPKPQAKPAPAAAKPKGPPAFKPPPFPGGAPGPKPAPSPPPVAAAPPPAAAAPRPVVVPSPTLPPEALTEEPTGAVTGAAISSAMQPPVANPSSSRPDAYPMGGASQPQMAMMGGQPADQAAQQSGMQGLPGGMGAQPADVGADLEAGSPAKPSPLILAALAVVVLLGVSATIWVIARPSRTSTAKHEVVDAGPSADAMPTDTVAQDAAKVKQQKAKKEELLGITADQRAALIEKNQKALASCYGKALKKEPTLAGSSVNVEVTISAKGKIDTVEIAAKDKDSDGKLAKCLQKNVKRWKFPKRSDKNAYQIKFALPIEG